MQTILLKAKQNSGSIDLRVFDELFTGLLSGQFMVAECNMEKPICRLVPLAYLFENFLWPAADGNVQSAIYHFMKGHGNYAVKDVTLYEVALARVGYLDESEDLAKLSL